MDIKYLIYGILLFVIKECRAKIKINSVSVPSRYELKESDNQLVLDCDYTLDENEQGFVLKWYHNGLQVYQFIPNKAPFALGSLQGRLDLKYETNSNDRFKKHSALVILNPTTADSGNYTCSVQSFSNTDRQTAEMIIIDPADSIDLKITLDQNDALVTLECLVINIYPYPEVKFLFGGEEQPLHSLNETKSGEYSYNVTLTAQINKNNIEDESDVTCLVKIPNTDYEQIQTGKYDDPKQTRSNKKSLSGKYQSESDVNENIAHRIASSVNVFIVVMIAFVLGR